MEKTKETFIKVYQKHHKELASLKELIAFSAIINRYNLSKLHDKQGRYVIYTIASLCKLLNTNTRGAVTILKNLERKKLIIKTRQYDPKFQKASKIRVKAVNTKDSFTALKYKYLDEFKGYKDKIRLAFTISYLESKMRLSYSAGDAYSDAKGQYVIMTNFELAKVVKCSERTIQKTLKELEKFKLLARKEQRNAPTKFYLPAFSFSANGKKDKAQTEKRTKRKRKKGQNNKRYFNKKYLKSVNCYGSAVQNHNSAKLKIQRSYSQKTKQLTTENQANFISKKVGIDNLKVNTEILKFTNNELKRFKEIIGLIINARNGAIKGYSLPKDKIRFEANQNMLVELPMKLRKIFNAKKLPSDSNQQNKYITASLETFFKDKLNIEDDVNTRASSYHKKHIEHKVPAWFNEPYTPDEPSEELKAKAKAALEHLQKFTAENNKKHKHEEKISNAFF